eukprot:Clim_evm9s210 gene=Clim_evmTU9s210
MSLRVYQSARLLSTAHVQAGTRAYASGGFFGGLVDKVRSVIPGLKKAEPDASAPQFGEVKGEAKPSSATPTDPYADVVVGSKIDPLLSVDERQRGAEALVYHFDKREEKKQYKAMLRKIKRQYMGHKIPLEEWEKGIDFTSSTARLQPVYPPPVSGEPFKQGAQYHVAPGKLFPLGKMDSKYEVQPRWVRVKKQNHRLEQAEYSYSPPQLKNAREVFHTIAARELGMESVDDNTSLDDLAMRFKVMDALSLEFMRSIPNNAISDMKTIGDLKSFYLGRPRPLRQALVKKTDERNIAWKMGRQRSVVQIKNLP